MKVINSHKNRKVYLVIGNNSFLRKEAINKIKEKYPEYIIEYFLLKNTSKKEIDILRESISQLKFSPTIYVIDIEEKLEKDINPILDSLNFNDVYVFLSSRKAKDSIYFPSFKNRILEADTPYPDKVPEWIVEFFYKKYGQKIDYQAAILLATSCENNLEHIAMELEKLYLYNKFPVDSTIIYEVVSKSEQGDMFKLIEYVAKGEVGKALKVFLNHTKQRTLLESLTFIFRHVKRLKYAKSSEYLEKLSLSPFYKKKLILESSKISKEKLEKFISIIYEADKLQKQGISKEVIITKLVVNMDELR